MNREEIEKRKKELIETFYFRHATKKFDASKKITEDDFNFILETGRLSPSSTGLEPWQFLVLENEELRDAIAENSFGAKGQMPTASHIVLYYVRKDLEPTSDYTTYIATEIRKVPEERMDKVREMYIGFQKDDIKILGDERATIDWASKQVYIALGNMMTAAAHIGIDSCPIEGFNYDAVREILKNKGLIDTNIYDLSVICAFGYREEDPKRPKTRRDLKEVVEYIK
ncbi:MAG: NAD(P)H-dependent oxidoreductase [Defluviitaleaceae bacterium]|nr:NAD(P)H-dependent oxidoreductase [Defluviitaleaceae bacterium]